MKKVLPSPKPLQGFTQHHMFMRTPLWSLSLRSKTGRCTAKSKGFTLVELLVVVAIIAVLAAVGVVIFTNIQKGARDTKRKADINAIASAYESKFDSVKGEYSVLTDANFQSGKMPTPPGAPTEVYNFVVGPNQNSNDKGKYKVCAKLGDATGPCGAVSPSCYCRSSSQSATSTVAAKNSLKFTGGSTYVNLGTPPALDALLTSSFTISVWIKPTSQALTNSVILSRGDSYAAEQNKFILIYLDQGKLAGGIRGNNGDGSSTSISSSTTISLTSWTHVALVRNRSSNRLVLYINGREEGNVTDTAGSITFSQDKGLRPLALGGAFLGPSGFIGSGFPSYGGLMDDVVIFNKALTNTEVSSLYTPTLSPDFPSLISYLLGYWKFDEGGGGKLYDDSPNGITGEIGGTVSFDKDRTTP